MKCSVFGLSHLGYVTGACLAAWGHEVVLADLAPVDPPVEPGLQALLKAGGSRGKLCFEYGPLVPPADVLWIALDMPLSEDCSANLDLFAEHVTPALLAAPKHGVVLVSSQLPVGTCATLKDRFPSLHFAYVPENLRRGQAVSNFLDPDYVIVGTQTHATYQHVRALYPQTLANRILWTTPESAEMTKHALNAYLGMCIVFANELSRLCELFNVDYSVIEHRLRQDKRIGKHAYLRAGRADTTHFLRDYWSLTGLTNDSPFLAAVRDGLIEHGES